MSLGACLAGAPVVPASAQSTVYELPGTTPVQTTGLAAGDRFPVSFLPFHYDWRIQAVTLPGRAAFAESGFVALDFDPNPTPTDLTEKNLSSAGPQLSYVLLSSKRDRLFAASLGGYRRLTGRDLVYESPQTTESTNDRHALAASIRYVAIRKLPDGSGMHYGFHAGYRDRFDKTTHFTAIRSSTVNDQIARADTGSTGATDRALGRTISLGIEAGRADEDLDVIFDVTYHRSIDELEDKSSSFSQTDTRNLTPAAGDPDFSRRERTLSEIVETTGRLNSVSGSAYLRRQSDQANRSVFFITNMVIGFGDVIGQSSAMSIDRRSDFLNDVRIGVQETLSDRSVPVDETSSSWLFRVGSGVELHGTYGALTASGGFAADIIASNYKYVPVPGADVRLIIDSPFREARLTVPAIAYIEVYRDIRIFGGAIFNASYSYDKESILLPTLPAEVVPLTINTNTTVSVSTRYPIGILADHPAGFFLEAAFGGSLASYDTWRLTLGLDLD